MNFNDVLLSKSERFPIRIEEESGKFYVSIPVSNRMIDYDEYYEIDKRAFDTHIKSPASALSFVERCRNREVENLLIVQPGKDRGIAT